MSEAWALTSCLLEDDTVPQEELTPEEMDRIDDPVEFVNRHLSDYYFELDSRLGKRDRRKLANNTYLLRKPDKTISVRLWNTDVIVVTLDGRTIANTNGWHTVTTKDRLNQYLPQGWGIYQKNNTWYWHNWKRGISGIEFTDLDYIDSFGNLVAQSQV